ncbi:MAG TPA: tyrosinase family protein [Lysobacter sp.]
MISLTRRKFVGGLAASPLLLWAPRGAFAVEPLVRYDAASPQGIAMLQVFAQAVTAMKGRAEDDPSSWLWQWYTHFVDGATTKADEINRIFGTEVTTRSTLANEVWNTCQSHAGQNANHFLPWHRMFVYYFERIVRQVAQRPDFTLPYWDYTSYDTSKRGILPAQFRMSDDPVFGSLYRPDRSTLANTGQPIHKNQAGDAMDISAAMGKPNYSSVDAVQGFCRAIDSGIHSKIHVLVGNSKNMGAVPYAGRDPLFWVHHSSIDRMWASWNRNGGANPSTASWASKAFAFANEQGVRTSGRLKDYFDTLPLGYTYDCFIAPDGTELTATTAASTTAAKTMMSPASIGSHSERMALSDRAAELSDRAVSVSLLPAVGTADTQVLGLDPAVGGKRLYLVLKNLHVWKQPEVLYHVYLRPGRGAGAPAASGYVGTINFFDAEFHDHGHGAMGDALGENFYSFDVTDVLKKLARSGTQDARKSLQVIFVPGGKPTAGAEPLVATIELRRQ